MLYPDKLYPRITQPTFRIKKRTGNETTKENRWQNKFRVSSTGLNFVKCQRNIPSRRWFHKVYKLLFFSTLNRVRSGHALKPLYKSKMALSNNPMCRCGEIGNLPHLILDCPMHIESIQFPSPYKSDLYNSYHINICLFFVGMCGRCKKREYLNV